METKRILLVIPSFTWQVDFRVHDAIEAMIVPEWFEIEKRWSQEKLIHASRNEAIKDCIVWKYDYLLFCDDDNAPKKDALKLLLEADKDIIGWIIRKRNGSNMLAIYDRNIDDKDFREYQEMKEVPETETDVFQVWNIWTGFVLYKSRIVEKSIYCIRLLPIWKQTCSLCSDNYKRSNWTWSFHLKSIDKNRKRRINSSYASNAFGGFIVSWTLFHVRFQIICTQKRDFGTLLTGRWNFYRIKTKHAFSCDHYIQTDRIHRKKRSNLCLITKQIRLNWSFVLIEQIQRHIWKIKEFYDERSTDDGSIMCIVPMENVWLVNLRNKWIESSNNAEVFVVNDDIVLSKWYDQAIMHELKDNDLVCPLYTEGENDFTGDPKRKRTNINWHARAIKTIDWRNVWPIDTRLKLWYSDDYIFRILVDLKKTAVLDGKMYCSPLQIENDWRSEKQRTCWSIDCTRYRSTKGNIERKVTIWRSLWTFVFK